jgi:hypothetical protein
VQYSEFKPQYYQIKKLLEKYYFLVELIHGQKMIKSQWVKEINTSEKFLRRERIENLGRIDLKLIDQREKNLVDI